MNENVFWLCVWVVIGATVITLSTQARACDEHTVRACAPLIRACIEHYSPERCRNVCTRSN